MLRSKSALLGCAITVFALCTSGCGQQPDADILGGHPSADATAEDAGSPPPALDDGGGLYPADGQVLDPIQDPVATGDGCAPATACPAGFSCGHYADPCSGHVFVCGEPCEGGTVCV